MKPEADTRERVTILSPKDLDISTFCGSGAGGQARNKVASGIQIRHAESGAIGRASDSRSQYDNKRTAFKRLLADPRMKFWLARRVHEVQSGQSIEEEVARDTTEDKLKLEIKNEAGQWTEVKPDYFETELAKAEHND